MRCVTVCVVMFAAGVLQGSDAFVVRFRAQGKTSSCNSVYWRDDLLLYNTNSTPVIVRVLGNSNGAAAITAPSSVILAPATATSLNLFLKEAWVPPSADPLLWLLHLDIPPGVVADSRDEFSRFYLCIASPTPPNSLGKVSLPIFRELVAPNLPQVHLGTDLGGGDARTNIGIYNGGVVEGTARVEIRRVCDDSVVEKRVVIVAPDTLIQVLGFRQGDDVCVSSIAWMRYAVVTVDQPSITFVSTVTERPNPLLGLAPSVNLGVTQNTHF